MVNLKDNNDSMIGKFASNRLSRSTSLDQPQNFLVNSKLDSNRNGFYINNQKVVDLFLQPLPRKHKIKGVAFLAHLSRRLVGELIVYPCSGVRPSVRRPSVVRPSSTISNMNISATSGPITMKFYQKHHWDGGKAALGFGPDRIQTLVSMATNSSHRVIMEKTVLPLFLSCFSSDPFYTCR